MIIGDRLESNQSGANPRGIFQELQPDPGTTSMPNTNEPEHNGYGLLQITDGTSNTVMFSNESG